MSRVCNETKIAYNCQIRDNMGDCYLLKETTEAMCAVIAAARILYNNDQPHPDEWIALETALIKFDKQVIE